MKSGNYERMIRYLGQAQTEAEYASDSELAKKIQTLRGEAISKMWKAKEEEGS